MAETLQNEAFEEDETGATAYYLVKDGKDGRILFYFSLKTGVLYDQHIDENSIKIVKKINLFVQEIVSQSDLTSEQMKAVGQALSRLTKAEVILRPGRGVYCFPEITPAMPEFGFEEGVRTPSVDEIAQAIAKRDCCRICPTAPLAQHYLGLSQQVPMNVVYFTDGSGRRIPMGAGHGILFKHTSDMKLFSYQSDLVRLLVVSMKDIGEGMLNTDELRVISKHLEGVSEEEFNNDIKLAPDWIRAELQRLYVVH